MLSQRRDKNTVKDFYEKPVFEEALRIKPKNIALYLTNEEAYLINKVKKGASVAEIGCGDGRIMHVLGNTTDKVTGLDFSKYYVHKAKENLPCSNIIRGDAKRTPLKGNSHDYVLFMFNTLGNLEGGKLDALKEAARILKQDGTIVLSVYSEAALPAQLEIYGNLGLHVKKIDSDAVYTHEGLVSERFSEEKLQRLIEKAGLHGEIKQLTQLSYIAELRKNEN